MEHLDHNILAERGRRVNYACSDRFLFADESIT